MSTCRHGCEGFAWCRCAGYAGETQLDRSANHIDIGIRSDDELTAAVVYLSHLIWRQYGASAD